MRERFYIIRVSGDYRVLIIRRVSQTEGDEAESENFYRFNLLDREDQLENINKDDVDGYFGGLSDGMGWGKLPDDGFDTMAELVDWAERACEKYLDEWWIQYSADYEAKHGFKPETPEAFVQRIRETYKKDFGAYPEDVPEDKRLSPEELGKWVDNLPSFER